MITSEWYDHRDVDSVVGLANATPAANLIFGPVREGFIWYIENLNTHIGGGVHTAIVKVYITTGEQPDPLDAFRQDFLGAAAVDFSRPYTNPLVIPPGYRMIVNFTGGTLAQGDQAVASIQRAWCDTNPGSAYGSLSSRERLSMAEQEFTESQERAAATIVGGSGWNVGLSEGTDDVAGAGYLPWTARDPQDAADNPAQPSQIEGGGGIVHGNP